MQVAVISFKNLLLSALVDWKGYFGCYCTFWKKDTLYVQIFKGAAEMNCLLEIAVEELLMGRILL